MTCKVEFAFSFDPDKIELSEEVRSELKKFTETGKRSVKPVKRAKIILELDEANERKPL